VIDIAAIYERLDNVLAQRGQEAKPYCIVLHAWNHRQEDRQPKVTFALSIIMGPSDVLIVSGCKSLESAFDDLMSKLDERLRPKDVGEPATLADLGEVRT